MKTDKNKKQITPTTMTKDSISFNWSDKNILIVEDDDLNVFLMSKYLSESKANCFYAKDGKSSLEYIKSNTMIDLILMDIQLPDINGFDLARRIKKLAPGIPIIAQTAYCTQDNKKDALKSGCNNYISKPINKEELLHLIQNQFMNN